MGADRDRDGHLDGCLSNTAYLLRAGSSSLLGMTNGREPRVGEFGNILLSRSSPSRSGNGFTPNPGMFGNAETRFREGLGVVNRTQIGTNRIPVVDYERARCYLRRFVCRVGSAESGSSGQGCLG